MRSPAKHAPGLGFFLRKKGGPDCFTLNNEGGFDRDPISGVFYFFCGRNRGFTCGDGGSQLGLHPLWLAGPAKFLMIAIKT